MTAASAVVLTSLLGLGIVYPLLPFQALALGATPQMVALLLAVDTLITLLLAPLWGHLSDRLGRKPLILAALAISTASYLVLAAAGSFETLLLSRVMAGVGFAAIPVLTAYVADRTSRRGRTGGIAAINAAYSLAFVFGPLITLATYDPQAAGFQLPALVACATGAAALLLAACVLDETRLKRSDPGPGWAALAGRSAGLPAGLGPSCGLMLAAIATFALAYAIVDGTLGVWSSAVLRWQADDLALAFLVTGAAAGLTQAFLVAPACRRFGERAVTCGSAVVMLAGLLLLAGMPGSANAMLAMALLGAGVATGSSCLTSLISQAAPEGAQGSLMGLTQSSLSLARILGPLWGGFALQNLGLSWPFATAAVLVFLALILAAGIPAGRLAAAPRVSEN